MEFDLAAENLAGVNRALQLQNEILRHQIVVKKKKTVKEINKEKEILKKIEAKKEKEKEKVEEKAKGKDKIDLDDLDKKLDKILDTNDLL